MGVPIDKMLAVLVVAVNVIVATFFPGDKAIFAVMAGLVSMPGLVVVLFRESLSFASFSRGVAHSSPTLLVGAIGWLMLLFFPIWMVYRVSMG